MALVEEWRRCPNCRRMIHSSEGACLYCTAESSAPGLRLVGYLRYLPKSVAFGIIIVNFVLFVAMSLSANLTKQGSLLKIDARTLFMFGAKFRNALVQGQYWRLVTAGFLHAGLLHLSLNDGMLLEIGNCVQAEFGRARIAVIYFVSIVAGFTASAAWSAILSVGSSRGLCGLAEAMIVVGLMKRSAIGTMIRRQYQVWLLLLFVWSFFPGSNIDSASNLGGSPEECRQRGCRVGSEKVFSPIGFGRALLGYVSS
jgi:rhomboid protease GluP